MALMAATSNGHTIICPVEVRNFHLFDFPSVPALQCKVLDE
jgi:hypothetical protein